MYNEELKRRFIAEYAKSLSHEKVCIKAFDAIMPFEQEWGADLCTKSRDELESAMAKIVGLRARSKWQRVIVYQKYVGWCLRNQVSGACDGMLNVLCDNLDRVRSGMVFNPMDLQNFLDAVFDPASDGTTDCIHHSFCWMAYAGMRAQDIIDTKCSEVDFDNMVIRFGGDEYAIYREGLTATRTASRSSGFLYRNRAYQDGKQEMIRNRVPGDTVVRGIRGVMTVESESTVLSKANLRAIRDGDTTKRLTYHSIWLSGLFYRIRIAELSGVPVDFSEAAEEFMEGKEYKLESGRNTLAAKKRAVMRDFQNDYVRWKAAMPL